MSKKAFLSIGVVALSATPLISCFGASSKSPAAYGSYEGKIAISRLLTFLGYKENTITYNINFSGNAAKDKMVEKPSAKNHFVMTTGQYIPSEGKWENDTIRTYTVAKDGIVLNTNLPDGLTIIDNKAPLFDIEKVAQLFDDSVDNDPTWAEILVNESTESTSNALASRPKLRAFKSTDNSSINTLYYNKFIKYLKDKYPSLSFDEKFSFIDDADKLTNSSSKDVAKTIENGSHGTITLNLHSALKSYYSSLPKDTVSKSLMGGLHIDGDDFYASSKTLTENTYPLLVPLNMIIYLDNKTNKDYKWLSNQFFSPEMQEILYSELHFGKMKGDEIEIQFGKDYAANDGNGTFRTNVNSSDTEIHAVTSTKDEIYFGLNKFN